MKAIISILILIMCSGCGELGWFLLGSQMTKNVSTDDISNIRYKVFIKGCLNARNANYGFEDEQRNKPKDWKDCQDLYIKYEEWREKKYKASK